MKNRLLSLVQKAVAPIALVAAMAAFSPVTAIAQNRAGHEGERGSSSGHSFSALNRGNTNAGRSFEHGNDRGGNFNRGNHFSGNDRGISEHRFNERRDFRDDRGFHGDRDRGFYRPGFRVGVGIYPSYGYVAPVCNPAGFYDQWGNWQYYPGCVPPYPY